MGLSSLSHAGLMEAAVKECIRDMLDHERRLREMTAKRYIVGLTEDEQTQLLGLITKGITSARLLTRARILLKADEGWKDKEIAQALNSSVATIERIPPPPSQQATRTRYV